MAERLSGEAGAAQSAAARISAGMVRLLARSAGRGPTRARTTVNTNAIMVMLEDALTTAERTLASSGEIDAVQVLRRTLAGLIRADAVGLVEQVCGRRVVA